MRRVLCLNGPNLDRLGTRDPAVYGDWTLAQLEQQVMEWGRSLDLDVLCLQSNQESELIDQLHDAADSKTSVVINPGALTHTSAALGDAIDSTNPVVEVHLSNVRARDRWRRSSFVSPSAVLTIHGRGREGYRAALRHLVNRQEWPIETVRYGPHPDQVMDLRRVTDAAAGVVLIHGGFWLDAWGRDTVESWAVDLARRGLPSAVIEYRRLGSGGGAVPTTADVAEGIGRAAELLGVDTFAVVGHSSGGHLAAWSACDATHKPALTTAVSGIFDLAAGAAVGVGDGTLTRFDPEGVTAPIKLGAPAGPIVLIHGSDDQTVPASQSVAYARHLETMGAPVSLDLVDAGHFDVLEPTSVAWDTVVAHLVDHLP